MELKNQTIQDPRFQSVHHDPRFIKPNNRKKPKSIDQQHHSDQDDRFGHFNRLKSKSNKPKLKQKSTEIPKLIDYARGRVILESSDEEEEEEGEEEHEENHPGRFEEEILASDSDSDSEQEVELGPGSASTSRHLPKQSIQSSSKTDQNFEIDLSEPELEEEEDGAGTNNQLIQPTKRIAIVNLDWDNLKPIDIYKVFSSSLVPNRPSNATDTKKNQANPNPSGNSQPTSIEKKINQDQTLIKGDIKWVKFYKSQFGKERMRVEDVEGPPKEIFKPAKHRTNGELEGGDYDDDDDELLGNVGDHATDFDEEALRKYQLDRLRYFYAIIELDSIVTAQHVFNQIDGTEFERTANIFDLSYVPDDMTFDEEDLWDECREDSNDYKGVDFSTDVLRHSKVKLTWDSEDPVRKNFTRLNTQKLTQKELDQMDFKNFLAPPSSDEEDPQDEDNDSENIKKNRKLYFDRHTDRDQFQNIRKLLGLSSSSNQQLDLQHRSESDGDDQQEAIEEQLDITFKPGFIDLGDHVHEDHPEITKAASRKSKNQRIKEKLKSKPVELYDQKSERALGHDSSTTRFKNNRKEADELELLLLDDFNKDEIVDNTNKFSRSFASKRQDDDDDGISKHQQEKHFDLNHIMKLEKLDGKRSLKKLNRKLKQKLNQQSEFGGEDGLIDRFSIDSNDIRFSNHLINDPEFAIDPSNPQFKKTKNMVDLLTSTSEKRNQKLRCEKKDKSATDLESMRNSNNKVGILNSSKVDKQVNKPKEDHHSIPKNSNQLDPSLHHLINHLKKKSNPSSSQLSIGPLSKRPKLV